VGKNNNQVLCSKQLFQLPFLFRIIYYTDVELTLEHENHQAVLSRLFSTLGSSSTQVCVYPRGFMKLRVAQLFLQKVKLFHIVVLRGPHAYDLSP